MGDSKQLIIGRDVPKKDNMFRTPEHEFISNTHASIIQDEEGNLFIKDLSSTNGTYVNNIQVIESPIKITDVITLGGKKGKGYKLPLEQLIVNRFKPSDAEFNEKMNKLKLVYNNYQNEIERINSHRDFLNILRISPGILLITYRIFPTGKNINSISDFFEDPMSVLFLILLITIFIVTNFFISLYAKKARKKQQVLKEQFQIRYTCPSCRKSLEPKTWAFIENSKECPMCGRPFIPN